MGNLTDAVFCSQDPLLLALIAIVVPFTAIGGGYAWFRFQRRYGWTSKSVLVLNLLLLSLIPLWGCVGFFTDEFGLHTQGEMYVLAVWFGACLGPRRRSVARSSRSSYRRGTRRTCSRCSKSRIKGRAG